MRLIFLKVLPQSTICVISTEFLQLVWGGENAILEKSCMMEMLQWDTTLKSVDYICMVCFHITFIYFFFKLQ